MFNQSTQAVQDALAEANSMIEKTNQAIADIQAEARDTKQREEANANENLYDESLTKLADLTSRKQNYMEEKKQADEAFAATKSTKQQAQL